MNSLFQRIEELKRTRSLLFVFLVAGVTILIHRILLLFTPHSYAESLYIKIYLFFVGVLLVTFPFLLLLFFPVRKQEHDLVLLFGIGFGLVLDQANFLIVHERTGQGYWSSPSLSGVLVICLITLFYSFLLGKVQGRPLTIQTKRTNRKDVVIFIFFYLLGLILPRVMVLAYPGRSTVILGFEIHHLFTGLVLFAASTIYLLCSVTVLERLLGYLSFLRKLAFLERLPFGKLVSRSRKKLPIMMNAFGLGLILDEYVFLLNGGVTDYDYWKSSSMMGVYFFGILVPVMMLYSLSLKGKAKQA